MRSLVLGAFIIASFGLTAHAAEPLSDAKGQYARRACHVAAADRTLRLLRDTLPRERRIAAERPVSRPVSSPAREALANASRPVRRPEPVRLSRAEPIRLLTQHLSLMVGIGF